MKYHGNIRSSISRDLNQIFFEFPFTVPEYFALITRALIVLEGIALTGDKDFDLFNAAYPLAVKHATRLFGASNLALMLGEASHVVAAAAVADVSSTWPRSSSSSASGSNHQGTSSGRSAWLGPRSLSKAL